MSLSRYYPLRITRDTLILFASSIIFFISNVDVTITNIVIPIIAQQFKVNILDTNIIVLSFLISYAMAIPLVEFFANKYGLKKTLLLSTIAFAISSCLCGLSVTINQLAFFRIIQGLAAGFFTPITRSVVATVSDEESMATNFTNVQTLGVLGQAAGPILGVYLVQWWGWQSIFYLNIPLCAVVIILIILSFNAQGLNATKQYSFDYIGYCLVSAVIATVFLLLFNFEQGVYYNLYIVAMLVTILFILIMLFFHIKLYLGTHIINFKLLDSNQDLKRSLLISFIARQYIGAMPFFVILIFHDFGFNNKELGYIMLSYAFGLWVAKFIFKILLNKYKNNLIIIKYSLISMFLFSGLCFNLLNFIHTTWLIFIALFMIGILYSLFFSAINLYTLNSVSKVNSISASTLMSIVMYISTSSSIAIFVIIASLFKFNQFNHYIFAQTILSIFLLLAYLISRHHYKS